MKICIYGAGAIGGYMGKSVFDAFPVWRCSITVISLISAENAGSIILDLGCSQSR